MLRVLQRSRVFVHGNAVRKRVLLRPRRRSRLQPPQARYMRPALRRRRGRRLLTLGGKAFGVWIQYAYMFIWLSSSWDGLGEGGTNHQLSVLDIAFLILCPGSSILIHQYQSYILSIWILLWQIVILTPLQHFVSFIHAPFMPQSERCGSYYSFDLYEIVWPDASTYPEYVRTNRNM